MPINEDVNSDELSKRTEKYSGAEIAAVCNEAAFMALDDDINTSQITMRHFEMALSVVRPRTSDETISYFDSFSFDK
jgi:SpoVK/Ycf46/Vps4 family AAA+-type ATPase